jgi:hypothetical protein
VKTVGKFWPWSLAAVFVLRTERSSTSHDGDTKPQSESDLASRNELVLIIQMPSQSDHSTGSRNLVGESVPQFHAVRPCVCLKLSQRARYGTMKECVLWT